MEQKNRSRRFSVPKAAQTKDRRESGAGTARIGERLGVGTAYRRRARVSHTRALGKGKSIC